MIIYLLNGAFRQERYAYWSDVSDRVRELLSQSDILLLTCHHVEMNFTKWYVEGEVYAKCKDMVDAMIKAYRTQLGLV